MEYNNLDKQSGVVLVVCLIMLLMLTLIGAASMQNASLEEKMAGNMRNKNLAFQAAESALADAETSLDAMATTQFVNNGTGGFYSQMASALAPNASPLIKDDAFWTSNPVASSSIATLGNKIDSPQYIVQYLGKIDCPKAAVGSLECRNFRVTVRATGGSSDAIVVLQTYFPTKS